MPGCGQPHILKINPSCFKTYLQTDFREEISTFIKTSRQVKKDDKANYKSLSGRVKLPFDMQKCIVAVGVGSH